MSEKCTCCPNHCDANNLNCGKGSEYFNLGYGESNHKHHVEVDESTMSLEEKLIHKMIKCGHFLHHSKKGIDLIFLTDEEKQDLIAILSKCLDNWE